MPNKTQNLNVALYTGSWPQNIGNAFFDLGLEAIIKLALPSANIFYTGGAVHWMFNYSQNIKKLPFISNRKKQSENSVEIAQFAEVDIVVVPGMCIAKEFVDNNGKTFLELAKRKIPVVFVGAGALEYTDNEALYYAKFLNKFYKYAIITRDSDTFNILNKNGIKNIWEGIDCAWFLPEKYTCPKLSIPKFNIMNFDSTEEPTDINHKNCLVLRTHHDCWGPLPKRYTDKENTLISDVPFDYLTLYANVNETYSDRVHACIATLTYGNKARLFSKTQRRSLFKKLGIEDITRELVSLDISLSRKMKEEQINTVRNIIDKIVM
jgi:hypothetical protein